MFGGGHAPKSFGGGKSFGGPWVVGLGIRVGRAAEAGSTTSSEMLLAIFRDDGDGALYVGTAFVEGGRVLSSLAVGGFVASRWVSARGLGSPRAMRAAPRRIRRMGQVSSSLGKKTSPLRCFSGR